MTISWDPNWDGEAGIEDLLSLSVPVVSGSEPWFFLLLLGYGPTSIPGMETLFNGTSGLYQGRRSGLGSAIEVPFEPDLHFYGAWVTFQAPRPLDGLTATAALATTFPATTGPIDSPSFTVASVSSSAMVGSNVITSSGIDVYGTYVSYGGDITSVAEAALSDGVSPLGLDSSDSTPVFWINMGFAAPVVSMGGWSATWGLATGWNMGTAPSTPGVG